MQTPADHVDIAVLEELKDIMEDQFQMLLNTFISDSEIKIEQLAEVIHNSDADGLRKIAHSLKGSALNVSAQQLSALALQLEDMGREEQVTDDAHSLFEALKNEFQQVKAVLAAYC